MILMLLFAAHSTALAHPGNQAADGCHYCRTNCDKWGVPWNERHCLNGMPSTTTSKSTPSVPVASQPVAAASPCPTNSLRIDGVCRCADGYGMNATQTTCYLIPTNAHYVGSTTDVWLCDEGYTESDNQCILTVEPPDEPTPVTHTIINHTTPDNPPTSAFNATTPHTTVPDSPQDPTRTVDTSTFTQEVVNLTTTPDNPVTSIFNSPTPTRSDSGNIQSSDTSTDPSQITTPPDTDEESNAFLAATLVGGSYYLYRRYRQRTRV